MLYIDYAPGLDEQHGRAADPKASGIIGRGAARFITAAETAALLELTEDLLFDWCATGTGLQPVTRPEGRRYRAEHVQRLAAMPRHQRLLAISLRRY